MNQNSLRTTSVFSGFLSCNLCWNKNEGEPGRTQTFSTHSHNTTPHRLFNLSKAKEKYMNAKNEAIKRRTNSKIFLSSINGFVNEKNMKNWKRNYWIAIIQIRLSNQRTIIQQWRCHLNNNQNPSIFSLSLFSIFFKSSCFYNASTNCAYLLTFWQIM